MSEIHSYERQQFEKLFKQEKIDRFDDRFKILEAFLQTEQHVTVEALEETLKDKKPPLRLSLDQYQVFFERGNLWQLLKILGVDYC